MMQQIHKFQFIKQSLTKQQVLFSCMVPWVSQTFYSLAIERYATHLYSDYIYKIWQKMINRGL